MKVQTASYAGMKGAEEGRRDRKKGGGLWAAVQNRNWAINADFPRVWWVKGGEGETERRKGFIEA